MPKTELVTKTIFNQETIELIKRTVAAGATQDEFNLFIYQAKRTGLDPLARQIYFVKRGGKAVIQTSIDGFRLIAERSRDYAGQDEPEFEETNGKPSVSKVRVYRWRGKERYLAAVGVAYWNEYCPPAGQDFMWQKMPHTMLSKVSEALALRKAFPQDLSGLYTQEEMDQAEKIEVAVETTEVIEPAVAQPPAVTQTNCTCNTNGKFHSRSCPMWTPPLATTQQDSATNNG